MVCDHFSFSLPLPGYGTCSLFLLISFLLSGFFPPLLNPVPPLTCRGLRPRPPVWLPACTDSVTLCKDPIFPPQTCDNRIRAAPKCLPGPGDTDGSRHGPWAYMLAEFLYETADDTNIEVLARGGGNETASSHLGAGAGRGALELTPGE